MHIKVIHTLSPSVSKTNVELYDSTFDALRFGEISSGLETDFALQKREIKLEFIGEKEETGK